MQGESKWQVRARKYRRPANPPGMPMRGAYIWRIRPQDISRTRPDHLRLNGKEFRWEQPPVVDTRTGERGHPGMDTHCRCYAEPVAEQRP